MNKRIIFLLIVSFTLYFISSGVGTADEIVLGPVGYFDVENPARFFTISGNYAYVIYDNYENDIDKYDGIFDDKLAIFDISIPSKPVFVGQYDIIGTRKMIDGFSEGAALGVTIVGKYAYIYGFIDLEIVDISNPNDPTLVIQSDDVRYRGVNEITINGNYAYYIAGNSGELIILDISNPKEPVPVGEDYIKNNGGHVSISGNYAYIANDDDGLMVVDISNPATPVLASQIRVKGYVNDVTVKGNYAYLTGEIVLTIVDISNPMEPNKIGELDKLGWSDGVVVVDNYAYLMDHVEETDGGFEIVNISDPTSPIIESRSPKILDGDPQAISGNYLFVRIFEPDNVIAILCIDESCKDEITSNVIKSSEYSSDKTVFEKIIQFISNTVFKNKTTTAVSFIALISIVVVVYGYARKRE